MRRTLWVVEVKRKGAWEPTAEVAFSRKQGREHLAVVKKNYGKENLFHLKRYVPATRFISVRPKRKSEEDVW